MSEPVFSLETLTLVLLGQGALLAVILWVLDSQRPLANRLLAMLLVVFACRLLALVLSADARLDPWSGVFLTMHNGAFLVGPLTYGYALAVTGGLGRLKPEHLWHLLPFVVALAWTGFAAPLYNRPLADSVLIRVTALHGLASNVVTVVYAFATLRLLARYRQKLLERFAAIERISLDWLRAVSVVMLVLGISVAAVNVLRMGTGWVVDPTRLIVVPVSVLVFYGVAILGFRQSQQLLLGQSRAPAAIETSAETGPATVAEPGTDARYLRSGLDETRALALWQRLQSLMQSERLYLQHDLQLDHLAKRLKVRQQTLSEVLNGHVGLRFYDYINGLRVEEAKRLLADREHCSTSILDLALQAGFSSKSTFNKYFKQSVGLTPSDSRQTRRAP